MKYFVSKMYTTKYIYHNVKLAKCLAFKRSLSLMVKNYAYLASDAISPRVVPTDPFK